MVTNGKGYAFIKSCPDCKERNICTKEILKEDSIYNLYLCLNCNCNYTESRSSENELIAVIRLEDKFENKRYRGVRLGKKCIVDIGNSKVKIMSGLEDYVVRRYDKII